MVVVGWCRFPNIVCRPVYSIYGIWMAGDRLSGTQALGTPNVNIQGDEIQWNFGQFLPVLLLALPIFTGWESFWEDKDEDRENRFGRGSLRVPRGGTTSQLDMMEQQLPKEDTSKQNRSPQDASAEEAMAESDGLSPAQTPHQSPVLNAGVRSRPASLCLSDQTPTSSPPTNNVQR